MYDIVFKNARVLDGTGAPWFVTDVAVKGGFIVRVGRAETDAAITVDAQNRYLAPGFIDMHSHSDLALVANPTADSKVMQGVTLEVIGQCGSSGAPRNLGLRRDSEDEDDEDVQESLPRWTDLGSYMDILERQGVSLNVVTLVGHGTVRRQVMGLDQRAPTPQELELMKTIVENAMEQGAFGLSTGLIYVPGTYAATDEIIELTRVVARYGGMYFSHIRNEGAKLLEAIEEAIRIGKESNVPVQISHFKASGQANWGKVKDAIALIERAREEGLDITADQYPYIASSTGLSSTLPSDVWAGGKGLERIKDPVERKAIIEALTARGGWDKVVIADLSNPDDQRFIGMSVAQIGEATGVSPAEACLGLLERNRGVVQIVNFGMCEEDVRTVMRVPWVMVGSDARALNAATAKGKPHPRSYGTFARILGKYVREEKVLRLEEAVRKMTSLPAMRLGLQDRGIIREGMKADLVLFDAGTVKDRATFTEPHQYAEGILWVLVNGTPVVREGKHTGERPGVVLKNRR